MPFQFAIFVSEWTGNGIKWREKFWTAKKEPFGMFTDPWLVIEKDSLYLRWNRFFVIFIFSCTRRTLKMASCDFYHSVLINTMKFLTTKFLDLRIRQKFSRRNFLRRNFRLPSYQFLWAWNTRFRIGNSKPGISCSQKLVTWEAKISSQEISSWELSSYSQIQKFRRQKFHRID